MKALLLLAAILLLPQEKNEAEELFRKMEEKLVAAKTIQVRLEGFMEPMKLKLAGELWLGEENRARMELEGRSEEATRTIVVICDGQRIRMAAGETARSLGRAGEFGPHVRLTFARLGYAGMIEAADDLQSSPAPAYELSDFKMGAKEKVGDRDAQIIEFKGEADATRLWIDQKTFLPLKRIVTRVSRQLGETRVTRELYLDFKLDEKIDAAKFELSKEKK